MDNEDNVYNIYYLYNVPRWWIMGTVILLNLANFAHWIAFPAIAKKAAAYYDVSGFAEWELGIDMICITLPSGEELDLIPTVSYAAGVPTCLIATYLIESRGLKTGVSNYLRSSCNQSHWGATYLQVLRLCLTRWGLEPTWLGLGVSYVVFLHSPASIQW